MSRNPDHRRRRPGRRPPHHHDRKPHRPQPSGFTGPGFRQAYDALLPGLKGDARRQHFNAVSEGIVLTCGLGGAVLGLTCFGWVGAVIGLGTGIAAGGSLVESQRFYRK